MNRITYAGLLFLAFGLVACNKAANEEKSNGQTDSFDVELAGNMDKEIVGESVFEHETAKRGFTLVDFYATWCGPCRQMQPIMEELKNEMKNVNIIKVDIDKNRALAEKYEIDAIPTFIVYRDGVQVWRYTGFIQLEDLKKGFK